MNGGLSLKLEANMVIKVGGLYRSRNIQWYDGIPFRCVNVVALESEIVTFRTEFPIRVLDCKIDDFKKRFHSW